MSDNLLPCPFCGGDGHIGGGLHAGYWLACFQCDMWLGYDATHGTESGVFSSRSSAAAAWNAGREGLVPELYDALEASLMYLECCCDPDGSDPASKVLAAARAALAKARGEK